MPKDINERLINNISKSIEISKRSLKQDSNKCYTPMLKQGDIILCDFTGLSTEFDEPHFAIVWAAKPKDENITVIPMTSKAKQESINTFTIGKIQNFITCNISSTVKESFVYIDKICNVSRKRIRPWLQKDPTTGNVITDLSGKTFITSLNSSQKSRIKESIRLFYLQEGEYLYNYLTYSLNYSWIVDIDTCSKDCLLHGYRLITNVQLSQLSSTQAALNYEVDGVQYSLPLIHINDSIFCSTTLRSSFSKIKYKPNKYNRRNSLLYALLSNKTDYVDEAKAILQLSKSV